jgi:hypothetical protein
MTFMHRFTAKWTNIVMNIAIGLQVFLGALTTGLGAALSGKKSVHSLNVTLLRDLPDIFARHLLRFQSSVVRQRLWRRTWRAQRARMSLIFHGIVQGSSSISCVRLMHSS